MKRVKGLVLAIVTAVFYVILMTTMFITAIILFFDNKNKRAARFQDDILDID